MYVKTLIRDFRLAEHRLKACIPGLWAPVLDRPKSLVRKAKSIFGKPLQPGYFGLTLLHAATPGPDTEVTALVITLRAILGAISEKVNDTERSVLS